MDADSSDHSAAGGSGSRRSRLRDSLRSWSCICSNKPFASQRRNVRYTACQGGKFLGCPRRIATRRRSPPRIAPPVGGCGRGCGGLRQVETRHTARTSDQGPTRSWAHLTPWREFIGVADGPGQERRSEWVSGGIRPYTQGGLVFRPPLPMDSGRWRPSARGVSQDKRCHTYVNGRLTSPPRPPPDGSGSTVAHRPRRSGRCGCPRGRGR